MGRSREKTFDSGQIVVSLEAVAAVRRGHPWIYGDKVRAGLAGLRPGTDARVMDPDGRPCGRALVDPASPIAARVWTHDATRRIDRALLSARLARALALRDATIGADTNALRWVHGEGDRMPGVVVDRYDEVAVVRFDGEAAATLADEVASLVGELGEPRGVRTVVLRSTERRSGGAGLGGASGDGGSRITTLRGPDPKDVVAVQEHGLPFLVDLARGQKTGAFLDQRENRQRVRELARGRRVLNLFSYAGGFSLAAAAGGASMCTSVDVAAAAHATAQQSFRHAGIPLAPHRFVTADVWAFLDQAKARGERWDLVVSDPPNMAPNAASKRRALTAYRRLHAACAAVLGEGGLLCAASCSSHVTLDDVLSTLSDEALGRDDLRVLEIRGAGPDHPVLPAFPEGRYLEFCVLG